MGKQIVCGSCGAQFDEDYAKCPFCGTMNYKGAEKEYMETLEDVRDDLEDLEEVPVQEIKKEVKEQKGFLKKVLFFAIALVVGIVVLFYVHEHKYDRDRRADYLWKQENFPILDEMYQAGNYEELTHTYLDMVEEDHPVWEWEHTGFCNIYLHVVWIQEAWEKEAAGHSLTPAECTDLFYDEWVILGSVYRTEILEQDRGILEPFRKKVQEDFASRWNMTAEEYEGFRQQIEEAEGIVSYEDCKKYMEK